MEEARQLAALARSPENYIASIIMKRNLALDASTFAITNAVFNNIRCVTGRKLDWTPLIRLLITECEWSSITEENSTRHHLDVFKHAIFFLSQDTYASIRSTCLDVFTPDVLDILQKNSSPINILMAALTEVQEITPFLLEDLFPLFSDEDLFTVGLVYQRCGNTTLLEALLQNVEGTPWVLPLGKEEKPSRDRWFGDILPRNTQVCLRPDYEAKTFLECLRYLLPRMPEGFLSQNIHACNTKYRQRFVIVALLDTLLMERKQFLTVDRFKEELFELIFTHATSCLLEIMDEESHTRPPWHIITLRQLIHYKFPSMAEIWLKPRTITESAAYEETQ